MALTDKQRDGLAKTMSHHFSPQNLWANRQGTSRHFQGEGRCSRTIVGNRQAPSLMPIEALSGALVNAFVEDGLPPRLEAAIEEYGRLSEQEESKEEAAAALPAPANQNEQVRLAANDTEPRTLYVRRHLLNAADIIAHFKTQEFKTLPADDMHVTITFSRKAVDWMKMDENWCPRRGGPDYYQRRRSAGDSQRLERVRAEVVIVENATTPNAAPAVFGKVSFGSLCHVRSMPAEGLP